MWSVPLEALEGKRLTCGTRRFVYVIWERRIKIVFVLKLGIAELEDFNRQTEGKREELMGVV